jgi:hypothetical protein
MLLLAAVLVGLVAGVATGGKLGNLSNQRFRWPFFVLAALLIKEVVLITPLSRIDGAQYVYAASLAALVAWTVWHFDLLPGVWLVSVGAALNLVVVVVNGGHMPVAREFAGHLVERGQIGQYVVMGPSTNVGWLADWIGGPAMLGAVYSPGDLVVAMGIAVVAFLATRRRPDPNSLLSETPARIVNDPP